MVLQQVDNAIAEMDCSLIVAPALVIDRVRHGRRDFPVGIPRYAVIVARYRLANRSATVGLLDRAHFLISLFGSVRRSLSRILPCPAV